MAVGPCIGIAIGTAINAFIGKRAKENAEKLASEYYSMHEKHFTVSQPGIRLGASILSLVIFGGGGLLFLLFFLNDTIEYYSSVETVWDAIWIPLFFLICFGPLILISIWALLKAIFWRVYVYEDEIAYTSFTGKKTAFTFKDITEVKTYTAQTGKAIKVYVKGKKAFEADPACGNYYVLLSRLESEGLY